MKLTKDQIKYIDTYLIGNGIKYWDIRLELIDHLASKLEKQDLINLTKTVLIKEFGTSASLDHILEKRRKSINKKYRKIFFQEILNFFKSTKNILIFIVLSFLYYSLFKVLDIKIFLKLSILTVIVPPVITVLFQIFSWIKRNNSIYLATALFYFIFSFLLYNMVIQLIVNDTFFEISQQMQGIIILISLPLYLVCTYSGFNVFYKTYKEYSRIYKELQSI